MPILDKIILQKKQEVERLKKSVPLESFYARLSASRRSFNSALFGGRSRKAPFLIAELKKKSPSEGVIRANFDIEEIAKIYNKYARAISVVTDETFFGGSVSYLSRVARISDVPLLRKDFIIDEYQIYESRSAGADAALFIASVLEQEELEVFIGIAARYAMSALVEVHNEAELELALAAGADIIGINNRDLHTFRVDIAVTEALAPRVPNDKLIVSESGFHTSADIARVAGIVDAVLVGTSLMRAENIEEKICSLFAEV